MFDPSLIWEEIETGKKWPKVLIRAIHEYTTEELSFLKNQIKNINKNKNMVFNHKMLNSVKNMVCNTFILLYHSEIQSELQVY